MSDRELDDTPPSNGDDSVSSAGSAHLPRRPPPSLFAIGVTIAAVVMTFYSIRATNFSLGGIVSDLTRSNPAFEALTSPDLGQIWSDRSRGPFIETLRLAVIGTVVGGAVALPFALWSTKFGNPNPVARAGVRGFNNVTRSFPDLLWALLFVAAVGVGGGGTLAGTLALTFFSLAVVTKLTSDTLDGIDMRPVEAAHAAGGGYTRMLRAAVIPQILPAYASFVLYSFELNLRASAVLGLVGAGGIGNRLETLRNANPADWEGVWGIVIMFFLVVFVVERLSVTIRRRLV